MGRSPQVPEGHTLHRVARAWQPAIGCRVRTSSPQGRFLDGARLLDGRVVEDVQAYGKHLLFTFGDVYLHVHLGLAGSMFEARPGGEPSRGVRLRLAVEPPGPTWDIVAPIRCELFDEVAQANLRARLGPDPLRGDDPQPAFARMSASAKSIGALLLDQQIIAGVGNVFRAEVLHRCHIHPERRGSSLTPADFMCLWSTLVCMMERATDEGRIITVDVPDGVDRAELDQSDGRYVYKQQRCRDCGAEVRTWPLGNRTAYACETCQPLL
ncbi:MAG TPA: DNA-formamidopyrimidine glycosylase family protein [Acidimicrobiales bacterium]|nr:DNA-formamidopyrimidine glycosylase family protein [Acidimicrobiales bacterium]